MAINSFRSEKQKLHTLKMGKANLGRRHSKETKELISQVKRANPSYHWIGKKRKEETKKKISNTLKKLYANPENHPNWIKDRTKLVKTQERNGGLYCRWRMDVYKRDNFKCRINNEDCMGKIAAHHILNWKHFPELRYNINNGITLCQHHHPQKREDETRLIPVFKELVGSCANN